jgi:CheY-like chemotaxis protein
MITEVEAANWKPTIARDFDAASELLEQMHYDLIVVDHRLDLDERKGIDFIRQRRLDFAGPIFAVASGTRADAAIDAGADVAVRKPLASHTFVDLLETSLLKMQLQLQRKTCFVSYSHADERFARQLYGDLEREGVTCWFAPDDLTIGAKTRKAIHEAIGVHQKLLLILSINSLESDWVGDEVEAALALEASEKREVLFPVRIDDAVLEVQAGWAASIKNSRHIGDFTSWKKPKKYRQALARLLRDLRGTSGKSDR